MMPIPPMMGQGMPMMGQPMMSPQQAPVSKPKHKSFPKHKAGGKNKSGKGKSNMFGGKM